MAAYAQAKMIMIVTLCAELFGPLGSLCVSAMAYVRSVLFGSHVKSKLHQTICGFQAEIFIECTLHELE